MVRFRSSSVSQAATVPARTLSLFFTLFLMFLGILYSTYLFFGSNNTIHTPTNPIVHPHQQFHSKITPNVQPNSKNRIVQENMKQGTPRSVWWTNQTAGEPIIEGFTNEFSYLPGEEVLFKMHSEELLLRSSIARYVHPDDPIQVYIYRHCRFCRLFVLSTTPSYTVFYSSSPSAALDLSFGLLQCQWCDSRRQSVLSRVPPSHHPLPPFPRLSVLTIIKTHT